jgi:cardiolipin synthase A/B
VFLGSYRRQTAGRAFSTAAEGIIGRVVIRRVNAVVGCAAAVAGCAAAVAGCASAVAGCAAAVAGCASASAGTGTGASGLIVEPRADPVGPFQALIRGARRTIDLTMYELEDARVESALAEAARRGVRVRVLLNGGYYGDGSTPNRAAYAYLTRRGVAVRYASKRLAFTHQKTLTVDGKRSVIMTLNFTARYYPTTRDLALVDSQPADVSAIERVFAADWAGRELTPGSGAGGLVWSPGATAALMRLVASARRSLDVETEELSDRPAIDALCAAAEHGVDVRLVMTYEREWVSAWRRLEGCGARVRVLHGEHPLYIHAKLIEVDGRRAFVGSQNLTPTSLERNRELGIVTADPAAVREVGATFDNDFSR